MKIDFKINENASVYEAMKRMAAHHIGCLAVTDSYGAIIGVVSERDYLCKVALLGKNSRVCSIRLLSYCLLNNTLINTI